MSEGDTGIEFIYTRKKIKYSNLGEMFHVEDFKNKEINIFLDMEYILDIFRIEYYYKMLETTIKRSNEYVSELVNFIGHYKMFLKKHGCKKVNFYLLYSEKEDKYNIEVVSNFHEERISKTYKHGFIAFLLNKFKSISELIEDVHVINAGDIDLNNIIGILNNHINFNSSINIIYSNNELMFQYMPMLEQCYIMMNGNTDGKIFRSNYFKYVFLKNKYKYKFEEETTINISYQVPYLILKGYYELKALSNFKHRKILDKLYKFSILPGNNVFHDDLIPSLLEYFEIPDEYETYKKHQVVVDLKLHYSNLSDADKLHVIGQLNTNCNVDRKALHILNEEVFEGNMNLQII
jgi:hypothetical protein